MEGILDRLKAQVQAGVEAGPVHPPHNLPLPMLVALPLLSLTTMPHLVLPPRPAASPGPSRLENLRRLRCQPEPPLPGSEQSTLS